MKLKQTIQNFMIKRCFREYSRALEEQQAVYDVFMRKQEDKLRKSFETCKPALTGRAVSAQEFAGKTFEIGEVKEDILIVVNEQGILNPVASNVILAFFEENEDCLLAYADEDICLGTCSEDLEEYRQNGVDFSKRCYPNMKPIPSPETFLSYQYFGNIWAVRTSLAQSIEKMASDDADEVVYDFLFKAWEKAGPAGVGNIPEILYHKFEALKLNPDTDKVYSREEMEQYLRKQDFFYGSEEKYNSVKEAHCRRMGIDAEFVTENGYTYPLYHTAGNPKVSIIIPSKDNPTVLETCIASVYEKSTYSHFEIIVIDNGSNDENKAYIEALRLKYDFEYLYSPMEFNYSLMNNIAAQRATGDLFLLLNDDMEVVTADWLERMVGQVMQEGIGAVGAKLLYPGTTFIQHVGVTNAVDGPVHKLLKKDDTSSYNRGRNKLVYNVIGVTGACLMVKREYFRKLGGLKEELKVAYNDVDFCFSLYELGLRNVVRNDVVLYHHESLSRGADVMSKEKMERLKWERGLLYRMHPEFYCRDPYEGANNSGGADFGLHVEENHSDNRMNWKETDTRYMEYPSGVLVGMDYCEKHEFIRLEDKDTYVIQGFAILPEADNCRYVFDMVLIGSDKTYVAPIRKKLRPNMAEGVPNASNVEMTGFCCYIIDKELPAGEYRVGIFATDRCSRQRLFQDSGCVLRIEA